MSFDWEKFIANSGIAFATTGRNVARGNLVVRCPYCGSEDEGMHLEINLEGKGWRCFRKPREHYGRNPTRLVMALLGCSWEVAVSITGQTINLPNDFLSQVQQQLSPAKMDETDHKLELPKEFRPFRIDLPIGNFFVQYLRKRGYSIEQIGNLTVNYGIRYDPIGAFKGRIIFPVYFENELVTWTGRTIYETEELRYKTLSRERTYEDLPLARGAITDYLLWCDDYMGFNRWHTIFLVEGPFDALRLRTLGARKGIAATCFFTSQPSVAQINLLHNLLPRFDRKFILLDRGTLPTAIKVASELQSLGVKVAQLPDDIKDPGLLESLSQIILT